MIIAQTMRPPSTPPALEILDAAAGSTWAEKVIEYAGRVCYASVPNMGRGTDFIHDRLAEGHEDIVEHGWLTWCAPGMSIDEELRLRRASRYVEVDTDDEGCAYISGNLRVWRELIKAGRIGATIASQVAAVAPSAFADLVLPNSKQLPVVSYYFPRPHQEGTHVELLGCSYTLDYPRDNHQQATFVVSGVSRALTHQLVRHRAASFSQESQRYVSLEKGAWNPVIPPSIAADDRALATLQKFWREAEHTYADLRRYNIRKEDSRFILPNAAESKIVVSMSFQYWKHFLWLRALDRAAQWEIRAVGQDILRWLAALAPENFAKEMDYYLANERSLRS